MNDTVRPRPHAAESHAEGVLGWASVSWGELSGGGSHKIRVPIGAGVSAVNQCSVGVMAVLFRGQENSMETRWSLLQQRVVEAGWQREEGWI